ncbi:hypothetical protein L3Q82_026851 [Scortum barcoo]|uniref:Uncharacterized protein n=1 Tax=Scortum barcoo TaxID=214431 RepID=A0ACB8WJN3_9TELE|nr:hypothetical protein L3Q82_026851 [Scortum barcoo]
MRSVYAGPSVVKKELSRKRSSRFTGSIYVPTLTYGHELWLRWLGISICFGCPLDASLGRCSRHVSHREEGPGKTQDTLERLCLSAGLGTPRGPPGRAGGSVWGEGSLGISAQTAASATRSRTKRMKKMRRRR